MEELAGKLAAKVASDRKIKLWNATPSARKAQVEVRTAQKWAKRLKEDFAWNIYEKQTNMFNRKRSQLHEKHKEHPPDFFNKYPPPKETRHDTVESLMKAFENFSLKETSIGNFIFNEGNLIVKRATLQPLVRNSPDNLEKRPQLDKEMGRNYRYELSTTLRLCGRSWLQHQYEKSQCPLNHRDYNNKRHYCN
ncbi:hypothetical protein G6F56_011178 [Rhizopus delemar]|nr:hypothetical protein G6F56_011178 [Rhizopus delemar]